jgi:uncharacterized cupin superfamily protein
MEQAPIQAKSIPLPAKQTIYPPPFSALVKGRTKRKLGDHFGLANFGVNLTQLEPGAVSALCHCHSMQDEFVYVLEGTPTLVLGDGLYLLNPGDCVGFKADSGIAHQLVNSSQEQVIYLEMGDRTIGDQVEYPNDDLKATMSPDGQWLLTHKDGHPY